MGEFILTKNSLGNVIVIGINAGEDYETVKAEIEAAGLTPMGTAYRMTRQELRQMVKDRRS